jgi:RNA polymerase sigma-70 factor (ECF subfamily)
VLSSVSARAELPADVVARARRGDRDAQAQFLRRYAAVLHQLVRRVACDRDPDALTQSLLARLLEVLPRFEPDGPASLTTWVFSVAHHFVIDELRRKRIAVAPLSLAAQVVDEAADPHRAVDRAELRDALEAALATLPEDQRRAFVFVHVYEQRLEEFARVEGVPLGTVKSRLFRARAALARTLAPRFREGDP